MLVVLSPAKSLNFAPSTIDFEPSLPIFEKETTKLVKQLRRLSSTDIAQLMDISPKLAMLNFERYQQWSAQPDGPKAAILAFDGDVYDGLQAESLSLDELKAAQQQIRILSGLYGILRPLDLISPHRLEMGTTLQVGHHRNLYEFWGNKIARQINQSMFETGTISLLNLASNEYFKSIDQKTLKGNIIQVDFKDLKNGSYKIISFYAKRARGLMTRFILQHGIDKHDDLKAFDLEGYHFAPSLSKNDYLVFTRDH